MSGVFYATKLLWEDPSVQGEMRIIGWLGSTVSPGSPEEKLVWPDLRQPIMSSGSLVFR